MFFVQAAISVHGDAIDLKALLSWVSFYFDIARDANGEPDVDDDGDEVWAYEKDFRVVLAGASFRLYTAFEAAEKSHRTGLGQTGAEKKVYLFPDICCIAVVLTSILEEACGLPRVGLCSP